MDRHRKLLQYILTRQGDANVPFAGLCRLLLQLGFQERIKGDHHIFSRPDLADILNLQPKGTAAKPYQVKQVRELILRYGLKLEE
jgi:predicted RNA binding protein YcfA (HicA-like mRNA interferase family)